MKEFCNRGWKYLSQMEDIFPHGGATGINAFHGAMTVPSQQNKETTSVLLQPIPSSMQTPVPTYMLSTALVGQTDLSTCDKWPLSDLLLVILMLILLFFHQLVPLIQEFQHFQLIVASRVMGQPLASANGVKYQLAKKVMNRQWM